MVAEVLCVRYFLEALIRKENVNPMSTMANDSPFTVGVDDADCDVPLKSVHQQVGVTGMVVLLSDLGK